MNTYGFVFSKINNNFTTQTATISNDYIASGFTGSNYLDISVNYKSNSNAEYCIKFTTSNVDTPQVIWHCQSLFTIELNISNIRSYNFGSGVYYNVFKINPNTTYWVKLSINGSSFTFYHSTDGVNYTKDLSYTDSGATTNTTYPLRLGTNSNVIGGTYFRGSIDLKETYISKNGSIVWKGVGGLTHYIPVRRITKPKYKYWKNVYSSWSQPTLKSDGVIGVDSFAVSASSVLNSWEGTTNNSRIAFNAFDGVTTNNDETGCWHSGPGFPQWLQFWSKNPLKISMLTIHNRSADGAHINEYGIAYSKDGNTFKEFIRDVSPNQLDGGTFTINIEQGAYSYWRINVYSSSGENNAYTAIGEVKITAQQRTNTVESNQYDYDEVTNDGNEVITQYFTPVIR